MLFEFSLKGKSQFSFKDLNIFAQLFLLLNWKERKLTTNLNDHLPDGLINLIFFIWWKHTNLHKFSAN